MRIFDRINFKQPKYMLPLIVYLPILATGYFIIDMFQTETKSVNTNLQTTEYINPNMPNARVKGDGVGGKYENMRKSFGKISDLTAVDGIERTQEGGPSETYESRYTDEDMQLMDAQSSLQDSLLQQQMQARHDLTIGLNKKREDGQQQALEEMNKALLQARLHSAEAIKMDTLVEETTPAKTELRVDINTQAVQQPAEDAVPEEVVRKVRTTSDYFNTLTENEPQEKLIKAIIDEEIKAVDGSRVRLRLLDDIEIGEATLSKGTYLYANMSGFGSQRVKGTVSSVLVDERIVKINLSIYDTDGMEGLYVPKSSFRETSKEVAATAMSGNMNLRSTAGNSRDMLSQWGMQAVQNAYQRTSSAIGKAVRKNKVRLKYGTQVYLVNSRDGGKK